MIDARAGVSPAPARTAADPLGAGFGFGAPPGRRVPEDGARSYAGVVAAARPGLGQN